jgi:hypothetical protein
MELEESFDSEDVARKEVAYIKIARLLNWRLTNGTSGGDGVRNPSPEVRAKRSKALLGKPFTETHKAAIRNRKISDRGRKQLSEAAKRRVANDPERHLALLEKARRAKNQRT